MCKHLETSLGLTDEKVPLGTHVCIIYTEEKERIDSVFKFLLSGLMAGERIACFSNRIDDAMLNDFFTENAISGDYRQSISFSGTDEAYFQNGVFDPDQMLQKLSRFYDESIQFGFPASRVIGEMSPKVERIPGGERLLEYESRVTMLLRDRPVTCVCQYDANEFDGATILEILKVHPKMVVNGRVINNPFFTDPEKYLDGLR